VVIAITEGIVRLRHCFKLRQGGPQRMPERVDQYRLKADKCLDLAETFKHPDAKRTMLAMAELWLTLAAQRVKNIKLVDPLLSPSLNLTKSPTFGSKAWPSA
jgi:hypothetical protein